MSNIIVNGPAKLHGNIKVGGCKNAALPIITATLLTRGVSRLSNVPDITDIRNLLKIIEKLDGKVTFKNNVLLIDTTKINGKDPDASLVKKFRASILLLGPMLTRTSQVNIPAPGGCIIGNRPLDYIFNALEKLGVTIEEKGETYTFHSEKLKGADIVLDLMSVTATENTIMAASLAEGTTRLSLAACESHVQDLCHFLNKMGARISGIGTNKLTIEGVKELKPATYKIISDEIEAGTYIVAAAATGSEIKIENIDPQKMDYSIFSKLKEAGVNLELGKNFIKVKKSVKIKPVNIWTAPSPHFPSDLQAPFSVLMTQADGSSLIHETMYEGRLNHLKELKKMGADASILDPHRAVIMGPTALYGKNITTLDLRAGATLIVAALIANGKSNIKNADIIDRGYENIVEKLSNIGADIKRIGN